MWNSRLHGAINTELALRLQEGDLWIQMRCFFNRSCRLHAVNNQLFRFFHKFPFETKQKNEIINLNL